MYFILVAFVGLLGFIPSGFLVLKLKSIRSEGLNETRCAISRWQWSKAVNHIEYRVRRWEQMASWCQKNGLPLFEKDSTKNAWRMWTVESVAALKSMKNESITFAPEGALVSYPNILFCGTGRVFNAKVKRFVNNNAFVIEKPVEFDSLPAFSEESLLVSVKPLEFELLARTTEPGQYTLFESEPTQSQLPMANGLTSFDISYVLNASEDSASITLEFKRDECKLIKQFEVQIQSQFPQGFWTMKEKELIFVPLKTTSGFL